MVGSGKDSLWDSAGKQLDWAWYFLWAHAPLRPHQKFLTHYESEQCSGLQVFPVNKKRK